MLNNSTSKNAGSGISKEADLGHDKIGKLLFNLAFPAILAQIINVLYNMVDRMYIGHIEHIGPDALTGVGVTMPVIMCISAFAALVSMGGAPRASIMMGKGRNDQAEKILGNCTSMLLIISITLTTLFLLFGRSVLLMFGASEKTIVYAWAYMEIYACGTIFVQLALGLNAFINAQGYAKIGMMTVAIGAVCNIILDPIFIFCFKWGMMGAAVATVIGQVLTAVLAVWYLMNMKVIKPASGDYVLHRSICGRMLTLGITSFLSQISLVAAMAAINNMLRKYGALDAVFGQEQYAQIPMAVVGIVMKFFQIVISIVVGMAAGCIPIVGYNMGAKKELRVRELFTRLLLTEALVGALALILAEGFPRQLIDIFGAANESSYYTDFAIKAFRTYLCMMILACVNKACFIFLQAVGKALSSTLLSMFREVVFGVGFALLLPVFFGLDGVLYSMPVSDILTFLISAIIIAKTYRELNEKGV